MKQENTALPAGIFCTHGPRHWQQQARGLLAGLRVSVKDLFAIAGECNGAGNPDWLKQAKPEKDTASSVATLMNEGAICVGFTHTDELAYSLEGNNVHYGAAENPKAEGRVCGGSSMGAAASVAGGYADIGLGTDTGGSIRVPASYCGLFGMRMSHNAVSNQGVLPLAPRFDTVGWLANTFADFKKVAAHLLPPQVINPVTDLWVCQEWIAQCAPDCQQSLQADLIHIKKHFKNVRNLQLPSGLSGEALANSFRILQGRDIARTHGQWFLTAKPNMAKAISDRFNMALAITDKEVAHAESIQQQWQQFVAEHLGQNGVLFLPTTPIQAPKLGENIGALRMQILSLTAVAGLADACQLHIPTHSINNTRPYGYSLLMLKGGDKSLIHHASVILGGDGEP